MVSKSKVKVKASKPPKKKMGRPSLYIPEYCEIASRACMLGAINKELAKILGVATSTIKKWMKEKPKFLASIKKGREIADQDVAKSLYKRAVGYSHPDVHISNYQGEITITPLIKHYPPDTGAAIFWLKNRRPDKWREKPEGSVDIPIASPVSVVIKVEDASDKNNS